MEPSGLRLGHPNVVKRWLEVKCSVLSCRLSQSTPAALCDNGLAHWLLELASLLQASQGCGVGRGVGGRGEREGRAEHEPEEKEEESQ